LNIPIGVIRPKQKALKDNNGPQEKKTTHKTKDWAAWPWPNPGVIKLTKSNTY
jgi:hypothetical protein